QSNGLCGHREVVQPSVELDRLEVEADEDGIEWVLDHAGIPAGSPGRDLGLLDEEHAEPGRGQVCCRRRPDDPAADDHDVRRCASLHLSMMPVRRGRRDDAIVVEATTLAVYHPLR